MSNTSRDALLLEIRPSLSKDLITEQTLINEGFQNSTLRPILKFQHDVLVSIVKNFIRKTNPKFFEESGEKRELFIQNITAKNSGLKNKFVGVTIGLMTSEELNAFFKQQSEFSKRICQMAAQRILSSMSELEN